jgi:hypothetical protein
MENLTAARLRKLANSATVKEERGGGIRISDKESVLTKGRWVVIIVCVPRLRAFSSIPENRRRTSDTTVQRCLSATMIIH